MGCDAPHFLSAVVLVLVAILVLVLVLILAVVLIAILVLILIVHFRSSILVLCGNAAMLVYP